MPDLTEDQVAELHRQIHVIPTKAVEVNANHKMFPEDWLFRWRWSKGKKQARGRKAIDDAGEDEESLAELKAKRQEILALGEPFPFSVTAGTAIEAYGLARWKASNN